MKILSNLVGLQINLTNSKSIEISRKTILIDKVRNIRKKEWRKKRKTQNRARGNDW